MMSEKGGEFPPQEQSKPVEQSVEREIGNRELPIWEKMPEVVETLRNNNRLILVSETERKNYSSAAGVMGGGLCRAR